MSTEKDENPKDFSWSDNDGTVVFPTVRAVAVYLNPDGDAVIRQEAHPLDNEDTFVIVPRTHLPQLIRALQQLEEVGG